ncbi:glycosyltransferase family 4 protein [Enterococcus camelliae]|uniref:Glycosyltransferase family 4 protein n=1 Tax=Enterococcus camelliae TaxID=453959 RepID=A0ABW5TJ83_9ENTE
MKTILFISPTGTLENGAEVSIFFLMRQLVEDGHNVINVFPKSYRHSQRNYEKKMTKANIKTIRMDVLKWWWPNAPVTKGVSQKDINFYYESNYRELLQIMIDEKVDLVISNTANVFLGAYAAKKLMVPHFWLIHEYPENEFAYYKQYIPEITRLSQKIFSVGGKLNKELNKLFLDKQVDCFYPYVELNSDSKLLNIEGGNKPNALFSIGKITRRKNQLELIKAFRKIQNRYPSMKLKFIGDNDPVYLRECQDYIKGNNIHNVFFLGIKENPWTEVEDSDICVLTSANETFGLVYVECLLNGIPVIISDNDGFMTAYEIFHKGSVYKLGVQDNLIEIITQTIDHFFEYKKRALDYSEIANEIYTSRAMYQNILKQVEKIDLLTDGIFEKRQSMVSYNFEFNKIKTNMIKYWIKLKFIMFLVIQKINS